MRISDWSSDVCSSDLQHKAGGLEQVDIVGVDEAAERAGVVHVAGRRHRMADRELRRRGHDPGAADQHQLHQKDEADQGAERSEEHTSELQSLMRISYAVFCLKNTTNHSLTPSPHQHVYPNHT